MLEDALILHIGPSPSLASMTEYIQNAQLSWTLKVRLLGSPRNLNQEKSMLCTRITCPRYEGITNEETDYMNLKPTNHHRHLSHHLKETN